MQSTSVDRAAWRHGSRGSAASGVFRAEARWSCRTGKPAARRTECVWGCVHRCSSATVDHKNRHPNQDGRARLPYRHKNRAFERTILNTLVTGSTPSAEGSACTQRL